MDNLLQGLSDEVTPESEELAAFINQQKRQLGKFGNVKEGRRVLPAQRGSTKVPVKRKTTHYLSKGMFNQLDRAKVTLREIVPAERRTSVSKSRIVEQALKVVIKDFEIKGENSILAKQILNDLKGALKN